MRLVFWQNIVSPHQVAHLTALARLGHTVELYVEQDMTPERRKMGWSVPDMPGVAVYTCPSDKVVSQALERELSESVHIFSGIRGFPFVARAFQQSLGEPVRRGLMVEKRPDEGNLKSFLRKLVYRMDARRYEAKLEFILITGFDGARGGREFYSRVGFPIPKLFPYGYFIDVPAVEARQSCAQNGPHDFVFIGELCRRKRCDLLLSALAECSAENWSLTVIGDGSLRSELEAQAKAPRTAGRVSFTGSLDNARAMERLGEASCLVLPSDFDGWGAVVNEALTRGVPIVCSDECGASDLLADDWRGEVFPTGSVTALASILSRRIASGPPSEVDRQRIRDWSDCISGDAAARYFVQIVDHVTGHGTRPTAPWFGHDTPR